MLNEKILVLMQDKEKGAKIQKALANNGFHVVGMTDDPFSALRILRSKEVHLTIIDSDLRKMSYHQFCDMIDYENLGPVILTGTQAFHTFKELPGSVYGLLTLPIVSEQLYTTIKMAVRQYKINSQLRDEVSSLRQKLSDRKVIDQAKRLLMEKDGISEDQAYQKIRSISMNKRVSLRRVADKIIDHLSLMKSNS